MRFLLNMNVSPKLGDALRVLGHDARHCKDLGLDRSPDENILDRARTDHAVIITADLDFPRPAYLSEVPCPGILLLRLDIPSARESIRRVEDALKQIDFPDWSNRIVVVENDKIRVNQVPSA